MEEIIKGEDKVAYIRALEFLIKLSIKSDKLANLFEPLLILALEQYQTTDELTKMNIVELVPELVSHEWTSSALVKSKFVQVLLKTDDSVN